MIQVIYTKQDGSKISVTPMPSSNGVFSDSTVPNSPATHCCLVRAANTSALRGFVHAPSLTKAEYQQAIEAQLADKDNWDVDIDITEAQVEARRDAIRGFTDKDVEKYIEEKTIYQKDTNGKFIMLSVNNGPESKAVESKPTEAEAILALTKVDSFTLTKLSIPDNDTITLMLLEEAELAIAKQRVETLISNGFLVTDLDAVDEDGNEIHAGFKAQLEILTTV